MPMLLSPVSKLRRIIGLASALILAIVLPGCSTVRLAYDQAPNLVYWWIDGHVDAEGEQTLQLRGAVDRWFAWHRRSQLPEYAALLARAQREVVDTVTPAAMCGWAAEVQKRVDMALDEALPAAADFIPTLTAEQLKHIERRLKKSQDEMQADFLQADLGERKAKAFERASKRFENLYGRLDAGQRGLLALQLGQSSFDPERWIAERRQRHRELLQALAAVGSAARSSSDRAAVSAQARAAARTLADHATRSPRADYRNHQQRLMQENCALAATLHNATTPAQRQFARGKLKGWEDDVRALVAAGNGAVNSSAGREGGAPAAVESR